MTVAFLRRLLAPSSVAVLGGAAAERVIAQCRKLGFPGDLWPVHPSRADVGGVASFPSLEALPGIPDAVFLGVNRHATIASIATLAAMEAGGAVCYGSGFAESGESDLQNDLHAAAGDLPFLGPNCYGFVNTFDRVALWPDEHGCGRYERGVAIVSQSGNVACNLTYQRRGVRLGMMITVGNQASIGTEDCIDALLDDQRITTIGLFVEAVRDAQRFAQVAARALDQHVPLVALQTGRSEAGAAIAVSHTGAMAGRAAAYDALFERTGVVTVRTPAELLETLKLLDGGGRLPGNRLVSLSCSGGEASLVADHAAARDLEFPTFEPAHRDRIAATLTDLVAVSNPFDYHTFMWGDRAAMAATFTATMDGPQDATMLVLDAPTAPGNDPTAWYTAADALADAADATGGRAVVVATMAECIDEAFQQHLLGRGVTPLLGLTEGLTALEAAAKQPSGATSHHPVVEPGAARLLDEASGKARLREWGIAVPDGRVVSADAIESAAAHVGYPVTVKALGVAHKSESGAVQVGLGDIESLRVAVAAMPTADRFLVEATVTDVVAEVLVAIRRESPIGWLVTLGFGGVAAELWADVTHLLAPVSRPDVTAALTRLRSAALLNGFRGRPPADVGALADLVVRLTDRAVADTARVIEIELNPVLVGRRGAIAVDALWMEEA
jgi:acyl-CoA synthetase (NDP forming)